MLVKTLIALNKNTTKIMTIHGNSVIE